MTYGVKYQFSIEATNGNEVDIFLLQRDYSGQKHIRALGRAPILKRERNGCILGTSLEIFAECRVDGEFAELYTSDAYEYKVEVYKRQILQWTGFVSPELYAEPDIAPPYDVQIIATDGLGELKNYDFEASARKSIMTHIRSLLQHTGLSLSYKVISDLQFDDDGGRVDAEEVFIGAVVDIDNLVGESSYDVLQKLLRSVGACITQQEGRWYLIRESDIYYRLEDVNTAEFGSMNSCDWWPVGNLNTDIMPAKNKIVITQENSYKDNIFPAVAEGINGGWSLLGGVYYDRDEACNILPNEQSSMAYTLISADYPLRQPLMLTIKARCLTDIDGVTNSRIGIKVAAKGGVSSINASEFYLIYGKPAGYERYIPIWTAQSSGLGSSIVHSWEPPVVQFGDPDIEEIDIQIPLSDAGNGYYAYAYAEELEITVFNPSSDYPICVYECSLTQCHRPSGLELTANIGNNAREVYGDTEVMLASGDASLAVTMYGIVVADGSITKWYSGNNSAESLLQLLALDIARQVALPRMRYRGKLNVPSMAVPVVPLLFFRDGAYYFLNTYAYDLLNDELEVELISIPNANVAIESETITEIASPGSASGTGVGGSGVAGGGNEPNLAGYATEEWVKEYVDAKTGLIDEKVETNITHIARAYTMIYELQDKDAAIDEALKDKTSLDDVKDYAKRFLSQAAFDPAKTHDYVVGSVAYSDVTDSAGAGGKALNLGIDLRIKDDIANAAEDDLDNGIFRNGLVTALGVKKYIDSLNLDQLTYDSVIGALGFTPLQASDLNGINGRLTAIEDYFSSEEDADTLINKWNEIVAFLNATEGTTLDNILSSKADKSDIPTKVGQLENDKGYITEHQDISGLATKKELNDGLNSKQNVISDLDTIRAGAALGATALQAVPDNYVTEKELTDKGYITSAAIANKVDKEDGKGLSSNDYTDAEKSKLASIADGAEVNVQADWNATSGDAFIKNKPSLHKVATSGSYNDLENKPTIPAAVTESTVAGWGFTKNTGTYTKPSTGIPKSDLASDVQTSLGKADTALQEHQSLAGYATQTWVNQQGFLKSASLSGYAKTADLGDLAFLDAITSKMVTDALGFTPFDSAAFTKASIKNALGIADWALAANKPSYDDVYLKLTGGTISGSLSVSGSVYLYSNLKISAGGAFQLGNEDGISKWSDLKSKIAYSFSEISSKPTTLSGYGITDAVKAGSNFPPTASDSINIIGYSGAGENWPASGPAMRWGTNGYYARLQVELNADNPRLLLSGVYNNAEYEWVEILTDKNFSSFGIANMSNNASGSANDILTSSVNGVVESLTDIPLTYGNLLTFAPKDAYYQSQLIINYQSDMAIRGRSGSWSDWAKVVTDKNFASYGVKAGNLNTTGSVNDITVPSIVGDVESLQNMPFHYCNILTITTTPHYYVGQIAIDYAGRMAVRGQDGATWSSWRTILDNNNIGTVSLPSLNLNGETITSWNDLKIKEVSQTATSGTVSIAPNVLNKWSSALTGTLTITFASGASGVANYYMIEFTTGATVPTINLPSGVKWEGGYDVLSNLVANTTYQISILNNLAVGGAF